MIKNSSEMTRWTRPTNEAFFTLHKSAIGFYTTLAFIAQVIWLIFSTKPLSRLLVENVDFLTPQHAMLVSYVLLAFLHWKLHELLKYIAYNLLDDDKNTVNSFVHYFVAGVVVVGLFAADVQGTTAFFRQSEKFEQMSLINDTTLSKNTIERESRYKSDLKVTTDAATLSISDIKAKYKAKIASARNQRTYDEFDVRRKKASIASLENERDSKVGDINAQLAMETRALLAAKNGELTGIAGTHIEKSKQIKADDAANAAKSHNYGWIISFACLLTLLGCTYQVTILRVKSGQKPVSRFTIGDATGGVVTKFSDATVDIFQRWAHVTIEKYHSNLTAGARELDAMDGSFNLKGQIVSQPAPPTPPSVLPPPMPPLPPTNNGGGNGGSGDSIPPPPAPIPQNCEMLKYYHKAQPVEGRVKHKAHFNEMTESQKTAVIKNKIENLREPCEFQEHFDAYQLINPFIYILVDDIILCAETEEENAVDNLAQKFADKRLLPTLSINQGAVDFELSTPPLTVITEPKNVESVITDITPVITAIEGESSSEFHYGDRLLKELKRAANVEVKNWENMNGTPKSIRERCIAKSSELDEAVRKVRASSEVRQTVCNYFADNISPIIRSKVEEWNKEGKKS
jgi:hypothetical protein